MKIGRAVDIRPGLPERHQVPVGIEALKPLVAQGGFWEILRVQGQDRIGRPCDRHRQNVQVRRIGQPEPRFEPRRGGQFGLWPRGAQKRGGDWQRVQLDDVEKGQGSAPMDILALDEALNELAQHDERRAQIVELRFFAGMSVAEVSEALGRSETRVRTDWYVAPAWLKSRLAG